MKTTQSNVPPEAAARGGSATAATSEAKAKALEALHASRRGKRVQNPGVTPTELKRLMSNVARLLRKPIPGTRSQRTLAKELHVDSRSLRRWLSGKHWPDAAKVAILEKWVQHHDDAKRPR